MRIIVAAACVGTMVMAAAGRDLPGLTELGGGVPAPPAPPPPAVRNIDPEATSVFTDQQAFLDAVTCRTISLESFENVPATNRIDVSELALTDVTITTANPPQLGIWAERFQGAFATHGNQWLGVEENTLVVPHQITLSFASLINHFGVNVTDFGDFGSGNLEFTNDIGDQATAAFSGQPSGNLQFFGIINSSRAFRTVTLSNPIAGEFFGIDEVYYCWHGRPDASGSRRSTGRITPG
jgi:hypothetical protein